MREAKLEDRFWHKVAKGSPDECWNWQAYIDLRGYGRFHFEGKSREAHRMAFFLTHGRWSKKFVCHICDNPICQNPAHFFEGSNRDNQLDCLRKGRKAQAKLKPKDIARVRNFRKRGWTHQRIAERVGVHRVTITDILSRGAWGSL
jgi:HNH endonuclease